MPLDNFRRILTTGELLSKTLLEKNKINFASIANDEVRSLRSRIFIFDFATSTYRPLHSYVPFYFAIRTPMLFYIRKQRTGRHHHS